MTTQVETLFQQATARHKAGDLNGARLDYETVLAQDPNHQDARYLLGVLTGQAGDAAGAAEQFEILLKANPDYVAAHNQLGHLRLSQGRPAEAVEHFRLITQKQPNYLPGHYSLGLALAAAGQIDAAMSSYRTALRLKPDFAEAHTNMGNLFQLRGNLQEAEACYRKATEANPKLWNAWNNLGLLLKATARGGDAETCFRKAQEAEPRAGEPFFNLGVLYQDEGKLGEAEEVYHQALQREPTHARAYYNLATILLLRDDRQGALAHVERAIEVQPDFVEAYYLRGDLLGYVGRLADWIENFHAFERATVPSPFLYDQGWRVSCFLGRFEDEQRYLDKLVEHRYQPAELRVLQLAIQYAQQEDVPAERVLALYRQHNELVTQQCKTDRHFRPPTDREAGPLRVGYLSADFRHHVMGRLMQEVIPLHDPAALEVHCYSLSKQEDELTERFRAASRRYLNLSGLSDEDAAAEIAADRLDVLVDLANNTTGSRPRILAYKPARVQITHLGYHGAQGLEAIDYRLTDHYADVPENQRNLVEELLPMEGCVFPFHHVEATDEHADTRASLGIPEDVVTCGEFVGVFKLSPRCLATWRRVLEAVPKAVLVFSPLRPVEQDYYVKRAAAAGIDPKRVYFIPAGETEAAQRARYRLIDMVLDTFPYAGGDTTLSALDMAVPVVTLCGIRHGERVGYSILKNLGVEDTIAHSEDEFVDLAVRLAQDGAWRAQVVDKIKAGLASSTLVDNKRHVAALEAAYRKALKDRGFMVP